MDSDFIVNTAGGSIWTFQPITDAAKTFVADELPLEGWQWMGPAFGVDARLADRLVTQLEDEGFVLEIK